MIKYPLYIFPDVDTTPFDEYKSAVHGNMRLNAIETQIQHCYDSYENAVNLAQVHILNPHGFVSPEKDLLKKLYNSNCDAAKKIRIHHNLFTSRTKRTYNNKCPYCILSEPDTIEHILPKDKYPEYAIHLYNLIPCCSKCNRYKGEAVCDLAGNPNTLNFYYHDPEVCQFLEVDCIVDSYGQPAFKYKLEFPSSLDSIIASTIINHFNRLHLIDRYNEEVIKSYADLELTIKSVCKDKSLKEVLQFLQDYHSNISPNYGVNHHYIAMLRCLISSPTYHSYLQSFCK